MPIDKENVNYPQKPSARKRSPKYTILRDGLVRDSGEKPKIQKMMMEYIQKKYKKQPEKSKAVFKEDESTSRSQIKFSTSKKRKGKSLKKLVLRPSSSIKLRHNFSTTKKKNIRMRTSTSRKKYLRENSSGRQLVRSSYSSKKSHAKTFHRQRPSIHSPKIAIGQSLKSSNSNQSFSSYFRSNGFSYLNQSNMSPKSIDNHSRHNFYDVSHSSWRKKGKSSSKKKLKNHLQNKTMKNMVKNRSLQILKSNNSLSSVKYSKGTTSSMKRNVRSKVACERKAMLKKQNSSFSRLYSSKNSSSCFDDSNISFSDVKRAIYRNPRKAYKKSQKKKRMKSIRRRHRKKSIEIAKKERNKAIRRIKDLCFSEKRNSSSSRTKIKKDPTDSLKKRKRKKTSGSRKKMSFKKKVAQQVKLNFKGNSVVKVEKVPVRNLNASYLRMNSRDSSKISKR